MIIRLLTIMALGVLSPACSAQQLTEGSGSPITHQAWTDLLRSHVDEKGQVNYAAIQQDSSKLNAYLHVLSTHPPAEDWPEAERMAYWINAYNAFTVKLIVDAYPLESIKDLNPGLSIPLVRSIWTKEFIPIGEKAISLDYIEHKVLRKEFEEPRIHFAINCASASCPPLRNEAFTGEKLEQQLTEQAIRFVNNPYYNVLSPESAQLSKIFSWFKGDFTRNGSLVDFLNRYAKVTLSPGVKISFREYDWRLNDQNPPMD